ILKGLPCGISPHSLFALKFACFSPLISSKLLGIFPVIPLIDKSSHCSFFNCPKLIGILPLIWFLEMSSTSSVPKLETELGICPVILFLERLRYLRSKL
ncbi:hypothetical protein GIB67_029344, partial [Kingdonia uniflora]